MKRLVLISLLLLLQTVAVDAYRPLAVVHGLADFTAV